jgi:hypothetical protein
MSVGCSDADSELEEAEASSDAEAVMTENSNADVGFGMSAHEAETEDAEECVGSHRLPCKKTLIEWAKSKFPQWLAQSERSSEPSRAWTWEKTKSKFSAKQVEAWFQFKDKKYHETLATIDHDPATRQFFGCTAMFHKDPAFISIFKKPLAKAVRKKGEKLKRYNKEFMFSPNSSNNAYPSSGHHQPQPKITQQLPQ